MIRTKRSDRIGFRIGPEEKFLDAFFDAYLEKRKNDIIIQKPVTGPMTIIFLVSASDRKSALKIASYLSEANLAFMMMQEPVSVIGYLGVWNK